MRKYLLCLSLFAWSASAATLRFNLSSELAKNHGPGTPHTRFTGVCEGDIDGDCLDDAMENELARKLNPRYYYDEFEHCPALYLYTQVRPVGPTIDVWRVDGRVKRVQVTYFFNYVRDCKDIGGHRGDSEHVRYRLSSTDLRQWSLDSAMYHRHGHAQEVSGAHLAMMATGVSGITGDGIDLPPIVAADQDGHGSWEGKSPGSNDCAENVGIIPRTCFNRYDAAHSYAVIHPILHNIGGPYPGERWRTGTPHLTVSGDQVFTERDGRREYWQPDVPFCGWLGLFPGCSGSLTGKLDRTPLLTQSRPITAADAGQPWTYQCTVTRNGVQSANQLTWTYRGQNPQGHLLYTVVDRAATHYYRLWFSRTLDNDQTARWILESVAPNDWTGPARVRCNEFDVSTNGLMLSFGLCDNGVRQTCP